MSAVVGGASLRKIAALYAERKGVYSKLAGVEIWPADRDARRYIGTLPIVGHPPCARWGRYWSGGPSAKVRRELGDDGGCFKCALADLDRVGGVIEHPEASHAFRVFGLGRPPAGGGWVRTIGGFWICQVEQGNYGHRARKKTWLAAKNVDLPSLRWGPSQATDKLDRGYHSAAERRADAGRRAREKREGTAPARLTTKEIAFAELLVSIARTAA